MISVFRMADIETHVEAERLVLGLRSQKGHGTVPDELSRVPEATVRLLLKVGIAHDDLVIIKHTLKDIIRFFREANVILSIESIAISGALEQSRKTGRDIFFYHRISGRLSA